MGRSNKNKNLPPYMTEARGWYLTRYPIPEDCRPAFPKYEHRKQLITNDRIDRVPASGKPSSAQLIKHRQNIEAVEDVIRLWKSKSIPSPVKSEGVSALFTPDQIIAAIDRWLRKRIDDSLKFGQERELKELNGIEVPLEDFDGRDLISHRLDAICEISRRIIKDQSNRVRGRYFASFDPACFSERGEFDAFSAIPDFHEQFAAALNSEGVSLLPSAPILGRAFAVEAFASAWGSVLKSELFHRCGSELHRIETEAERETPQEVGDISLTEKPDENNLESVFDRYLKSKPRKDIDTKRRHWKALVNYFGNIDISKIKSPELENFKISLSTSPKTRKSKYTGIDRSKLKQALIDDGHDVQKFDYLSGKTLYTYFATYKPVFEFAADLGIISQNPVNKTVMPEKPKYDDRKIEVRAYTDDEIVSMFSKPIFTGCSKVRAVSKKRGVINWGYRNKLGDIILKDGRYFMPILALYTGARMEELGGAKVADIKIHNGISFLDLRYRSLKTPASRRVIPLHPILTENFKFLEFVAERRRAGDTYLFPEFDSGDITDGKLEGEEARDEDFEDADPHVVKRTATYSRWFGKWRKANGFTDRALNFHSLRHSFKHALRRHESDEFIGNEEFSDLLTGHSTPHIGRKYGKDLNRLVEYLPKLYREVIKVRFPDFPLPDQ